MTVPMKNIVFDSYAMRHNAKALTGDPEFKKTEKLVPVEWV
jgi:hypothetical protein